MYFYIMRHTTAELLELIEARRAELGWSQVDVGRKAFGKADNSVISNMKRGSSPTYDRLAAICDAMGLEFYIGKPRGSVAHSNELSENAAESELTQPDVFRRGYLPIPWLHFRPGTSSVPVAFARSWLDANGLLPDNLACIVPDEVSLEGFDGLRTIALIDRSSSRKGFGIFAVSDGSISVARVLVEDDMMVVQAKDARVAPKIIKRVDAETASILGRVVWIGARLDI